jgi:hypothetical protein
MDNCNAAAELELPWIPMIREATTPLGGVARVATGVSLVFSASNDLVGSFWIDRTDNAAWI